MQSIKVQSKVHGNYDNNVKGAASTFLTVQDYKGNVI